MDTGAIVIITGLILNFIGIFAAFWAFLNYVKKEATEKANLKNQLSNYDIKFKELEADKVEKTELVLLNSKISLLESDKVSVGHFELLKQSVEHLKNGIDKIEEMCHQILNKK